MIDKNVIVSARKADVIGFFECYHGFSFMQKGGGYRCKQHQSLAVKSDRRSWYWHSKKIGGHGVIDYLMKVEGMKFPDAVGVASGVADVAPSACVVQEVDVPKSLVLPEKTGLALRLYDYLCVKRCIDKDIVNGLIQEGKLYEDKRGNVVFVGFDEHNDPRFACVRGTYGDYRMDCSGSDKRYGFNMPHNGSEHLYVFESAIDSMSHATLTKTAHNRISLAGTSDVAIPFFLNQHKNVRSLIFCMDNDEVGRTTALDLSRKYADKGYTTSVETPRNKDFNADLVQSIQSKSINNRKDVSL